MVEGGAVRWLFELKGVGVLEPDETHPLPKKEDLELLAIEAGAEDIYWHDNILDIYTTPTNLASLKEKLEGKGLRVTASLDWVPKERVQAAPGVGEAVEQLFEALDEQSDVQDIYSNL